MTSVPIDDFRMSEARVSQPLAERGYVERSVYTPLALVPAVLVTGFSWAAGGLPTVTDLGFLLLTLACLALLVVELVRFPRRFGIGGFVLYGGVLMWFCYDYMTNYFAQPDSIARTTFSPDVIAKAAYFHALFVLMMAVGMQLPVGLWLERALDRVPEPTWHGFYFYIMLAMLAVGLSPYVFFTNEHWYEALWKEFVGGRSSGAEWTVGRTGNLNYEWGAYIAQITQIGKVGGQFAVFYALLIARRPTAIVTGWLVWLFWLALAFGSGTRSQVAFMSLPAMALVFLKYQAMAAAFFKGLSLRAYVATGVLAVFVVFLIQFQSLFRNTSYVEAQLSDVSLTKLEGNSMFSEGMIGYDTIPRKKDFLYNSIPGESLIRPMPQTLFNFAIGPIPRALWNSKPVDPVWEWYNTAFLGTDDGTQGTTIATGLVGSWYFPYGYSGVMQGGLLIGWLMILCERVLQGARGRALVILLSLAMADWLFRQFRAMNFSDLYMLAIGWGLMASLILAQRALGGATGRGTSEATA